MAFTRCPYCKNTTVEIVEKDIRGAIYRMNLIQCGGCGAPFGAIEYYNLGKLVTDLQAKVDSLESALGVINRNLAIIDSKLR